MAINYKVKDIEDYHPFPSKYNGEVTIDDMVKEIEKSSNLSESDIRKVVESLEDLIITKLDEIKVVKMDKLGIFCPNSCSEEYTAMIKNMKKELNESTELCNSKDNCIIF